MSGETPDLSGGIGGGAGPGGNSAAGGASAGAGAGGVGGSGAGGVGGAAGSQIVPILIAGGLSGIVAMGALIALNLVPVHSGGSGASPRGLVLVACPASGPVLAVIDPGQKLLVTGRSADGAWLRVYLPGPGLPYAWAPADELQASGDTSGLPVAGCDVAAASLVATPTPTPTPTVTPTATPTATPVANGGPRLEGLTASSETIYLSAAATGCKQSPGSVTISVSASDPDGVSSVDLFWKVVGGSYARKPFTHGAGNSWSAQLFANTDIKATGNIVYYVLASDASAALSTRRIPTSDATFVVKKCDLPPTVTSTFADGPLGPAIKVPVAGKPGCASHLVVTAHATDPDDSIANVVFWYTPYLGSLHSIVLAPTGGGDFQATLTNATFKRLMNSNEIHLFPWYVIATDKAGRSSPRYTLASLSLTELACP